VFNLGHYDVLPLFELQYPFLNVVWVAYLVAFFEKHHLMSFMGGLPNLPSQLDLDKPLSLFFVV
jgi:hypothetical protein